MNRYDIELGTSVPVSRRIYKHHVNDDSKLELAQTLSSGHDMLFDVKTVFPFTLFPDTISLDRTKLTIARREFIWSAEVMSIRIEDILNISADVGPFFGSIKIYTRFFNNDKPYSISYLKREDALKIKSILQGYIIAMQKSLDCSTMKTEDLVKLLKELG